ncbi:D-arabinono-1,4-lactone oxidase [Paramicrobacterium chengjingii]|uniref:FAD-binding protein n=1 Tax=Paramicrobacterium chengjingii TaxID=2769067 RepID=A0ABX6YML3_9MICO|nr:D-arabinono-1,4-lactone oxidase [Microbacterium chengjingii]QPZ39540.1 FAD-binding protein [Microbacterium chengjingii]
MTATGETWRNWGRTEKAKPIRVERPRTAGAVQRAVVAAAGSGIPIKAVGASHSFSGIAAPAGVLLELDDLTGLIDVDERHELATFSAGTRLRDIPRLLARYGLAMENLGDIDSQSLAGAISTGTHGTGASFRGLAAQVAGVTLVTGTGEQLHVDADTNAELLPAVALGLGSLGILVDVTVHCVPAFDLAAVEKPESLESVLDSLPQRVAENDHFEFYWFPHTETALTKTNTRMPSGAARRPLSPVRRWLDDTLVSNRLYEVTCGLGSAVPAITPTVNRLADKLTGNREFTDASHRVFTTKRTVRFAEMEYALPAEQVADALREVKKLIDTSGWSISFPVEVRFAASDDLWLSTASRRETGYIAVHRYARENPTEYFRAVEAIMRDKGGRPHWGKMHWRDAESLRESYPRFDDFVAIRDRLDPSRLFRNPYLDRVLGA